MNVTLRLPPYFRSDRDGRDLPTGELLSDGRVRLTYEEAAEYLNDAEYYAHPLGAWLDIGLKRSAQATVAAFRREGYTAAILKPYLEKQDEN